MNVVHVSHGADTEDFTNRLKAFLVAAGARVSDDLSSCTALVVVMSPDAEQSELLDADIAAAVATGVRVAPVLRRDRPMLALAGLPFEEVLDDYDYHQNFLPRDEFVEHLTHAPAVPVGGWLPVDVRTRLRRLATEARHVQAAWPELIDYATATLGEDHPTTLACRAAALQAATDDATVIAAWQNLIADQTRVLGPEHDGTLFSRHNLAEIDVMSSVPREETIARLYSLRDDEHRRYGPGHWRWRWTEHFLEQLDR